MRPPRHGAADVLGLVVLEQLQQLDDGRWVGLKCLEPAGPWQSRPSSLGHQPSGMLAGVGRPFPKLGKRRCLVMLEIGPDAELGGEPFRQLVLRGHRLVEVIQPVVGDEVHVRQVEEALHTDELFIFRTQRGGHQAQRVAPVLGQVSGHGRSDVASACGQFQCIEPVERSRHERGAVEGPAGVDERVGDPFDNVGTERVLQWLSHTECS